MKLDISSKDFMIISGLTMVGIGLSFWVGVERASVAVGSVVTILGVIGHLKG